MRIYFRYLLFLSFITTHCLSTTYAQNTTAETIHWYTIEQAEKLAQKDKRKIFVDVYTSWCGVCKNMDKTTLSQPHIIRYINENYYPVKLDAEQHDNIVFKNKTYKFVSNSGVSFNEFAAELLKGQMSYPSIVFLDENLDLIQAIQGYRQADQFEIIMTYFGEDNHKKTPWTKYEKAYLPMKR